MPGESYKYHLLVNLPRVLGWAAHICTSHWTGVVLGNHGSVAGMAHCRTVKLFPCAKDGANHRDAYSRRLAALSIYERRGALRLIPFRSATTLMPRLPGLGLVLSGCLFPDGRIVLRHALAIGPTVGRRWLLEPSR